MHTHVIHKLEQREKNVRPRVDINPEKVRGKDVTALYKIILVGDSGTGKTSLLLSFIDGEYRQHPNCTIGVDFKLKLMKVDKVPIKL